MFQKASVGPHGVPAGAGSQLCGALGRRCGLAVCTTKAFIVRKRSASCGKMTLQGNRAWKNEPSKPTPESPVSKLLCYGGTKLELAIQILYGVIGSIIAAGIV